MSKERSKGYWGKIVGNYLLLFLCAFVVGFVVGPAIEFINRQLPFVGVWIATFLSGVINQLIAAVGIAFLYHLAATIFSHPKGPNATVAQEPPQGTAT